MAIGTRLLYWPWKYLTDHLVPAYRVAEIVQPSLDIGQHNAELQLFRQSFVMAAGNNTVFLPGLSRAAQLNGTVPLVGSKGGRRWLSLSMVKTTAFAVGDDAELSIGDAGGRKHELRWLMGAAAWPANQVVPLIRGSSLINGGGRSENVGYPGSVYVPDPLLLFVFLQALTGGETLTISGAFIESDTWNQPLPDMFA